MGSFEKRAPGLKKSSIRFRMHTLVHTLMTPVIMPFHDAQFDTEESPYLS